MSEKMIAPLFRGATKPVMFMGVPMNALVLVTLPSILALMLSWESLGFMALIFVLPLGFTIPIMRQMTKRDDQYLNMWLLEMKEKLVWTNKNKLTDVVIVPPKSLRHKRFIGK